MGKPQSEGTARAKALTTATDGKANSVSEFKAKTYWDWDVTWVV